jgi:hypothetical protein
MKLRTFKFNDGTGKEHVFLANTTGNFDKDDVTEDYKRNPQKYEMEEASATARAILRESFPEHRTTPVDKARQLERDRQIREAQAAADVRRALRHKNLKATDFVESDQTIGGGLSLTGAAGTPKQGALHDALAKRNFGVTSTQMSDGSTEWQRGGVEGKVIAKKDGSWTHGNVSGKDVAELRTHLDSDCPQESFRDRTATAFRALGLSESAAQAAADRDAPLFARAVARTMKRDMRHRQTDDPLVSVLLDPKRKW